MDYLIYIIPVLVVIGVVTFLYFNKKNNVIEEIINISDIIELIDKRNVQKVSFIRNKIVLDLNDYLLINLDALKEIGASGITVVGDKIKFYFEKDNELIYKEITKYIEG